MNLAGFSTRREAELWARDHCAGPCTVRAGRTLCLCVRAPEFDIYYFSVVWVLVSLTDPKDYAAPEEFKAYAESWFDPNLPPDARLTARMECGHFPRTCCCGPAGGKIARGGGWNESQ